jgi:hypothetical protein
MGGVLISQACVRSTHLSHARRSRPGRKRAQIARRSANAPGSISLGTNSRMSGYQQHCGY